MHDGIHFRTRSEDLAVNEPLHVAFPSARIDRLAVEVEFHDVSGDDQFGAMAFDMKNRFGFLS